MNTAPSMSVYFLFSIFMYNKCQVSLESLVWIFYFLFPFSLYTCIYISFPIYFNLIANTRFVQFSLAHSTHACVQRAIYRGLVKLNRNIAHNLLHRHTKNYYLQASCIERCFALIHSIHDTPYHRLTSFIASYAYLCR